MAIFLSVNGDFSDTASVSSLISLSSTLLPEITSEMRLRDSSRDIVRLLTTSSTHSSTERTFTKFTAKESAYKKITSTHITNPLLIIFYLHNSNLFGR